MKPLTNIDDPRYVKAFSHPLRIRILAMLQEQTSSPTRLADRLGEPLYTVAYHVRMLNELGLIELDREAPRRGAIEHFYRANEPPTISDDAWARASSTAKQTAIQSWLQVIHHYVSASAAAGGFEGESHATRTSMLVDPKARKQVHDACMRFLEELDIIKEDVGERLGDDPDPAGVEQMCVIMLQFVGVRLTDETPATQSSRGKITRG